MLLSFFRINDPYRLLGLLMIIVLVGLPHFIYPADILLSELKLSVLGQAVGQGKLLYTEIIDDSGPLLGYVYGMKDFIFGSSLTSGKIIAIVLIFFQSSYFAILLINNKAYAENTYLPALIFGLLSFVSFDLITLSPELIASTLLLFALNQLFHEIEFKIQRDDIVLKVGFYIGLSTFVLFSYWVFLVTSVFLLIAFARASLRKILLLLFGFSLPHVLLCMIYYYRGGLDMFWHNFYLSNFTFAGDMLVSTRTLLVLSAVPLVYFAFAVVMMNREARFTKYQSQLMQVMFLWLITSMIQVLMARSVSAASLLPLIPPLAYFISHYLLLIRRRWRAELMLWVFLISIISVHYLAMFGKIGSVSYANLFPSQNEEYFTMKGKKVMNLGDGLLVYQENTFAGFFLNWNLSKDYFAALTEYEDIETIARSLHKDPPEVIIDKDNLFEKVTARIPYLKTRYQKIGDNWVLNN